MDKIVRRIWWIVVPTAIAVLGFQLYWLYTVYNGQQQSFHQVAADAFQKAYDKAMFQQLGKMEYISSNDTGRQAIQKTISRSINLESVFQSSPNFKEAPSSKTVTKGTVMLFADDSTGTAYKDSVLVKKDIDLRNFGVDPTRLLSSLLGRDNIVMIDTAVLKELYDEELANRNIDLPFRIIQPANEDSISSQAGFIRLKAENYTQTPAIAAQFQGLSTWLLLKIISPIILSFLLVLLIIFCIWILWRIILKQKKLEDMKNDFISNITHELKTPVAILSATNETLLNFDGIHDAEKTGRYLRLERDELKKLQVQLDRIIHLTRLENKEGFQESLREINLGVLVNKVADRFRSLPGVEISIDNKLTDPVIQTQALHLETVLSNLVDNAIKYSPRDTKPVVIHLSEENQYIQIDITDEGLGIEKSQLPFIFDKFYRVPHGNIHDVKGYGLGLSHVKSLLSYLGGSIGVKTEPGKGSTFSIQLKKVWK